jgi:PAS domain S-box-containing protein
VNPVSLPSIGHEQARLADIVQNSMDAIITVDADERIIIFNSAAAQVFGYSPEQALGQPLSMLLPQSFRAAHSQHLHNFAHSGTTSRRMGIDSRVRGLRANGEEFPLEASISRSRAGRDGSVLLTVILRDITQRVRAQEELDRARTQLRELSISSQTAREEEKSRIARELHDELGQSLTALKMDLAWLKAHTSESTPAVTERIRAMQAVLDSMVAATRRISSDLRPLMLDDLGLMAALEWLTQDFSRRTGVQCMLTMGDEIAQTDARIQSALYRAVQEALTNAARHAQASTVRIDLSASADSVHLRIRDDGRGMDAADQAKRGSFGLIGMRERIYILGGTLQLESAAGQGTAIAIDLPLAPHAREAAPRNYPA